MSTQSIDSIRESIQSVLEFSGGPVAFASTPALSALEKPKEEERTVYLGVCVPTGVNPQSLIEKVRACGGKTYPGGTNRYDYGDDKRLDAFSAVFPAASARKFEKWYNAQNYKAGARRLFVVTEAVHEGGDLLMEAACPSAEAAVDIAKRYAMDGLLVEANGSNVSFRVEDISEEDSVAVVESVQGIAIECGAKLKLPGKKIGEPGAKMSIPGKNKPNLAENMYGVLTSVPGKPSKLSQATLDVAIRRAARLAATHEHVLVLTPKGKLHHEYVSGVKQVNEAPMAHSISTHKRHFQSVIAAQMARRKANKELAAKLRGQDRAARKATLNSPPAHEGLMQEISAVLAVLTDEGIAATWNGFKLSQKKKLKKKPDEGIASTWYGYKHSGVNESASLNETKLTHAKHVHEPHADFVNAIHTGSSHSQHLDKHMSHYTKYNSKQHLAAASKHHKAAADIRAKHKDSAKKEPLHKYHTTGVDKYKSKFGKHKEAEAVAQAKHDREGRRVKDAHSLHSKATSGNAHAKATAHELIAYKHASLGERKAVHEHVPMTVAETRLLRELKKIHDGIAATWNGYWMTKGRKKNVSEGITGTVGALLAEALATGSAQA